MKQRTGRILLVLLVGLLAFAIVRRGANQATGLDGDEYGSISFQELSEPKVLSISGINIDFSKEAEAASGGHLYFPEITFSTAFITSTKINIQHGAEEKYQRISQKISEQRDDNFSIGELEKMLNAHRINRESWRDHFYGNYYYRKAKSKLTFGASLSKKREIFFPAIEKYKSAIRRDPTFPMPHMNLAVIYYEEFGDKKSAAHECKLAAKYNLHNVPRDKGDHTDVFGIATAIMDLTMKVSVTLYEEVDDTFSLKEYSPGIREIRPEKNHRMRFDEKAQNMEIFVKSMETYLSIEEKAKLYHNLGYYYHTRGAYHLALLNYRKAFDMPNNFDDKTLKTIASNIKGTYEKLDWLETEEVEKIVLAKEKKLF